MQEHERPLYHEDRTSLLLKKDAIMARVLEKAN